MYSTTDFRKGLKILHDGKPWVIVEFQHVSPGKGSAFVRTRLKSLETGRVLEITYKSGDKVERPDLATREMQLLYHDASSYTFMDNTSYEQFTLSTEDLGDAKNYLLDNSGAIVTFFEGRAVSVEIDTFVNLEVVSTTPNIKGDTSGGGGKPATLSTGLVVTVPFHIAEGDVVKVDTRSATYIEKVGKR
jgi:elongation factor P